MLRPTEMSHPAPTVPAMSDLTDRELQILTFERGWWKYAGAKDTAIRDLFGCSATRYYQELNALIDEPAALAAEPVLVKRLQRLRDTRRRRRAG